MRVSVVTLGCKTNLAESDEFKRAALNAGHQVVPLDESPDLCIINTCTVTAKTDYQCRQLIRRALRQGARVVVTGCYSVVSEQQIKALSRDIEVIRDKTSIIKMFNGNNEGITSKKWRARPFVKVQDGCNHKCSYCIIPLARGRSRSRTPEDVLKEVIQLEESGYREVVLTGIHLGDYGRDLSDKVTLEVLVKTILNNTRKIRVRLSSLEVHEVTEGILDLVQHERVCPHLHIPLQSGDNRILRLMNRPYRADDYRKRLLTIKKKVDNIALGTDVIVGFPTETEVEFERTRKLIEEIGFAYIHVFPFSKRPGTKATEMTPQVTEVEKKRRVRSLRVLDQKLRKEYRTVQVGRTLEVIRERALPEGLSVGKSENYLKVYFRDKDFMAGSSVKVRIFGLHSDGLFGIPV